MPSLVDRYLDPGSRIAQKTRRSPRDGPGKSRHELYGFSKEDHGKLVDCGIRLVYLQFFDRQHSIEKICNARILNGRR